MVWRGRGGYLPETGEADVDEKVGTASGDEEDTDRRNCGSQRWVLFDSESLTDGLRRRRGLTEDGDDHDEDGVEWVRHCVMDSRSWN